jgi:hypothetical protein
MNTRKATNLLKFALNVLMIVGLLLPYSSILFNGNSFYFAPMKLAYCVKPEDCRHEVGHLIDDDMGHISRSKEFGTALMLYVMYQIKYSELDRFGVIIFTNPGSLVYSNSYQPYNTEAGSSPQEELYAKLYAEVDGDISKLPPLLRKFYKTNPEYDKAYTSLITTKYYLRSNTMDQLKVLLAQAKQKAEENKELLIRIGLSAAGALAGALVTVIVLNQQQMAFDESMFETETTNTEV